MDNGIRTGLFFGLSSGVITTLGLMVGLEAGTQSQQAVVGGILVIAIADALSDALGIHISKEAETDVSQREVWLATLTTLAAKFFTSVSFIIPTWWLPLPTAIVISIIWGIVLLTTLSFGLAKLQNQKAWPIITEHLLIATAVLIASHWVGKWIHYAFS